VHDLIVELPPERVGFEVCTDAGWVTVICRGLEVTYESVNPSTLVHSPHRRRAKSERNDALDLAPHLRGFCEASSVKLKRKSSFSSFPSLTLSTLASLTSIPGRFSHAEACFASAGRGTACEAHTARTDRAAGIVARHLYNFPPERSRPVPRTAISRSEIPVSFPSHSLRLRRRRSRRIVRICSPRRARSDKTRTGLSLPSPILHPMGSWRRARRRVRSDPPSSRRE